MSQPLDNPIASPVLVPLETRLGVVHLAVTDAQRALSIWRDVVGLNVIDQSATEITLGAGGKPLVILYPGARAQVAPNTIGLYHLAIHVPTRRDFARTLNRAMAARVRISPTDHLVSEALYLWDLDGNGIEITFETPWRGDFVQNDNLLAVTKDGQPHSGREPIDVPGLLAELEGDPTPFAPMADGTRIGHVHVHVNDLDAAMEFYRDQLGFAGQLLSRRYGMGDVYLNYAPHILAFNIWAGANAHLPPEGLAGLKWFEIVLPDEKALDAMRQRLTRNGSAISEIEGGFETTDPSGNRVQILFA